MKIETYEIEPADTEISQLASDSEHRSICERLGLEGQLQLSNNPSETVVPYRIMTKEEQMVYEFHCPIKTSLAKYQSDAIPVRVLQVAAHATDLDYFEGLDVWHPKEARLDPVLVGYHKAKDFGSSIYLLARWGQVWKDYPTLLREARAGWKAQRLAKLAKAKSKLEQMTKDVDSDMEMTFAGDYVESSIYV